MTAYVLTLDVKVAACLYVVWNRARKK